MNWKEFKTSMEQMGVKDDDLIYLHQHAQYSCAESVCTIEKCDPKSYTLANGKHITAFLISDSTYQKQYISPCEATGR